MAKRRPTGTVAPRPFTEVLNGTTMVMNGVTLTAQSPATYSIVHDPVAKRVDMERRAGQTRAELVAPRMTIGATQRWLWDFVVNAQDDGAWDVLGQCHGLDDGAGRSPIWAIYMELGQLLSRHRSTNVGGVVQSSVSAALGAVVVGQRYSVDITIRQHATDGICLFKFGLYGQALTTYFNITGQRFGFPDEESGQPAENGPYFKPAGVYGDTSNTTTARASFYNMTLA